MDITQPQSAMSSLISDARQFPGLSLREVQRILGPDTELRPGEEYGNLTGVTSAENHRVFRGTIYLRKNRVELVYIPSWALTSFREEDLRAQLGTASARLRSRAGKTAELLVFAEQGVACSAGTDGLHFLEVFPPRTQREYEAHIYRDPGPFIR